MKRLILPNEKYRKLPAISNSELKLIDQSPSDLIWAMNAPQDTSKLGAFDFGTCLHTAILEPERFEDSFVMYSGTKTRDTVHFNEFMQNQSEDSIVLFEHEYNKIKLTVDSAKAHPTFNKYLELCKEREESITGDFMGTPVKIRPDLKSDEHGVICELKSTDDISAWRESALWKNPLFTFDYGHGAAMYMNVYQQYLNRPVDDYIFLLTQKKIVCGRYPVAVVHITREELDRYGFIDRFYDNIERYKECLKSGDWTHLERFPLFNVGGGEIEVSYDE